MPWSAKAQELVRTQYAAVGAAAEASLAYAAKLTSAIEDRGPDFKAVAARIRSRAEMAALYRDSYRRYCWPVSSVADYKLAPFHLLATESGVHINKDHVWHMETLAKICGQAAGKPVLFATPYQIIDVTDEASQQAGMRHYWLLLKFLGGEIPVNLSDRAILLAEVNTALGIREFDYLGPTSRISSEFLDRLNSISPRLAKELWLTFGPRSGSRAQQTATRLGIVASESAASKGILAHIAGNAVNPFFEEENLLQLAHFLLSRPIESFEKAVSPWRIRCAVHAQPVPGFDFGKIDENAFSIEPSGDLATDFFESPEWCDGNEDRQRFNTGLLLRYALRGNTDFLDSNRLRKTDRGPRYSRPASHWAQQRYSGYQGRDSFGPPWIPLSSFTETLLFELLRWPGSGVALDVKPIRELLESVRERLDHIKTKRGQFTSSTFLEQSAPWPSQVPAREEERPLRVGIVQSIIPGFADYAAHPNNPQLNGAAIRTTRRAHLAAVMEGISQMLRIRGTHRHLPRSDNRSIDLLVFPELAVHPDDIDLLILPFVRQHRCIALFGQIYHPKDVATASPLINSALWLVPEWSPSHGLHVKRIEQGKRHLTRDETSLSPAPTGFLLQI